MSADTIHDLLPIPPGTKKPHPYQVFGLEVGEQDSAKIRAAIARQISELKSVKGETDDQLWKRAAVLVNQSRAILTDPEKKAELDARFGIVTIPDPDPVAVGGAVAGEPTDDPLAAWLPHGDPLAAWDPNRPENTPSPAVTTAPSPAIAAESSGVATKEPSSFATAARPPAPATAPAASEQPGFPHFVESTPVASRRRKSSIGFLVPVVTVTLLVLVGGLGYFMFWGPGGIEVRPGDGRLTVTTKSREKPESRRDRPGEENEEDGPARRGGASSRDPVMGALASDASPPQSSNSLAAELEAGGVTFEPADSRTRDGSKMQDRSPAPNDPGETKDAGEPTESDAPGDPQRVAKAEQAIQQASQLVRAADWQAMTPAAERAVDAAVTASQKERSQSLYQLAELATYYRGGIERAIGELEAGDQIALTPSLSVVVVDAGDNSLAIRRNARTHSYAMDELPFVIAYAVAPYTMPTDDPTIEAGKAAYQAIFPLSTEAHRDQSLDWLAAIRGEVEGADPARVAEAIERLFRNDRNQP